MKPPLTEFTIALSDDLLKLADQRATALGKTREEWISVALTYVLTNLPPGATPNERRNARQDAAAGKI